MACWQRIHTSGLPCRRTGALSKPSREEFCPTLRKAAAYTKTGRSSSYCKSLVVEKSRQFGV